MDKIPNQKSLEAWLEAKSKPKADDVSQGHHFDLAMKYARQTGYLRACLTVLFASANSEQAYKNIDELRREIQLH